MTNNSYISLKDRIYKGIFEDKQYLRELKILADKIKAKCRRADNEATVVSEVEISLHDFIRDVFNLDITPHKEIVTPTRTRLKGRIDSKIGAVIFEYKHHSKYSSYSLFVFLSIRCISITVSLAD